MIYIKGRIVRVTCGQEQPFGHADDEALVSSSVGRVGLPCEPMSARWLDSFSFVPVTLGLILMAQLGALATFSYAVVVGVPIGFRRAAPSALKSFPRSMPGGSR